MNSAMRKPWHDSRWWKIITQSEGEWNILCLGLPPIIAPLITFAAANETTSRFGWKGAR